MKTSLLLVTLTVCCNLCFGQDTLFLDKDWKPTTRMNAEFFRIDKKDGNKWIRMDYFYKTNQLQMKGTYVSLTPEIEDGYFEWYHSNGKLQDKGNYENGKKVGKHVLYYDNGISIIKIKEKYEDGVFINQNKLTPKQISKRNYQEVISDTVNLPDTIVFDNYPMYPGGEEGIHKHIAKKIIYPRNAEIKGIQGRVILGFIVEKDGKIRHVWIEQSVDPELDAEAIRVLKTLKIWVPGYVDGVPVRVRYSFPFSFRL